jgi:glycosyltransferase involved in cell wall biosynthesis
MPDPAAAETAGPQLACVVIALHDPPELVGAVESLVAQAPRPEIVVVASGRGDPEGRLAAAGLGDVRVERVAERIYPGAARNIGIDATSAPFVAFLAADCRAEPGWVAARLDAHRAGAPAVASVIVNPDPESASACAAQLLLFHSRTATTPVERRLLYGLSYARTLFHRFGRFREDLRAGEDSEFRARLGAEVPIVWAPDVRTAHLHPTALRVLLRDFYVRGRRQVDARRKLDLDPRRRTLISATAWNTWFALAHARRLPAAERHQARRALPLIPPATVAYIAGIATAGFRGSRRSGSPRDGTA